MEVNEHVEAQKRRDLEASGGQPAGFESLTSSPSIGGRCCRTGAGPHSSGSSLVGPARGSGCSSTTVAATETDTFGTSPLSKTPPGAPHVSHLQENGTAVCGAGIPDKGLHHLPHLTATDPLMPEPVTPQAAAIGVHADVGWQSATAGQHPSATGVAFPVGDPVPELELFGGELGSEQGELHLTDADLLDVATVFMDEHGLEEESL